MMARSVVGGRPVGAKPKPFVAEAGLMVSSMRHDSDGPGRFDTRLSPAYPAASSADEIVRLRTELEIERAARQEAERISAAKDEVLSIVSHELRTPLNAILGWAQVLRRVDATEEVREAIAVIERNGRAQARMLEDLLDMSRIISGRLRLDTQQVMMDQAVEAAIDALVPVAAARRIRITTDIEPYAGPVFGDPTRLQQIAANLLSNAVKFSRDGGEVHVTLEATDGRVTLTVRDEGDGIPPELLTHLFDRFRTTQHRPGTTRRHSGLGLGLAMTRHLVELHNGSVTAQSDGPGRGATFTVTLPVGVLFDTKKPAATMPAARPMQLPSLRGARILLVDDEADARAFLQRVLRECDGVVTTAESMQAALEALDHETYDVLISDIAMPDHDGYELIHRVRQRAPDRGGLIRALALTAFASQADLRRSLSAGFNMHVSKPVDAAELLTNLKRLLGPRDGEAIAGD
jgi:signal transduction histidine kinase/ActR/RegA family two-component response regulator